MCEAMNESYHAIEVRKVVRKLFAYRSKESFYQLHNELLLEEMGPCTHHWTSPGKVSRQSVLER